MKHNRRTHFFIQHIILAALLFIGVAQPVWSLPDDCSLENVDCRGPIVPPFVYFTTHGMALSNAVDSAQAAAEYTCSEHFMTPPYGSACACEATIPQFQEGGSYVGGGIIFYPNMNHVSWMFGIERSQYIATPGVTYSLTIGADCDRETESWSAISRQRDLLCPTGYWRNTFTEPHNAYCYKTLDIRKKPIADKTCKVGNPVFIGSGNKQQRESDYQSDTIRFIRTYNSDAPNTATTESIGKQWRHTYDRFISAPSHATDVSGSVYALRQNGDTNHFVLENGVVTEATMTSDRLELTATGWSYITSNNETELYGIDGRLLTITTLSGRTQNLTYDNTGRLTEVSDDTGRTLTFTYDSENRIATMADLDGKLYSYAYDAFGKLTDVTYPDDTLADLTDNPKRLYHYEQTIYPLITPLTGITDENDNRYATWSYDGQGRAISSEHAGGADLTTFTYNADGSTTVTNALGKQTTYHFEDIHGYRYVASVEGHQTSYCAGANKAYSYDANGNISSKTDWNGVTTTYSYDMDRNLELTRTAAVGTPQERTITTEWHPDYRLPLKVTEPGKITEYSYDAQGRKLSSKVSSVQ